jgi:hypothetical protein
VTFDQALDQDMSAFSLIVDRHGTESNLRWRRGTDAVVALPLPAILEITDVVHPTVAGERFAARYWSLDMTEERGLGIAELSTPRGRFRLIDEWVRIEADCWQVNRQLETVDLLEPTGVRLILALRPVLALSAYRDFRYFAPPALTDLNDLNEDGVEDYLETKSLHFRDDRLNLRSFLAWSDAAKIGIVLSRFDAPEFDANPDRAPGREVFLQTTDIGSLGIEPQDNEGVALVAAYPFAERTRSNALLVKQRSPFAAFAPAVPAEPLTASWTVRLVNCQDAHQALWEMWTRRYRELAPIPVDLPASLSEIAASRVESTLDYFIEERTAPFAAGFVTNCHPQDGKQISNVIQFGFTGQNNLNAFNLLRLADANGNAEWRRKALRVFDFFAATACRNRFGLIPGFYNADTRRFGSWWTGLILPLAYAKPGGNLETLMGPLYGHLHGVIESLAGREGIYLRCVAEEYEALLAVFRHQRDRGDDHEEWRACLDTFSEFLIAAQNEDGSFYRAYTADGEAITEPSSWFGQTDVQQKSSTAVVVPFLVGIYRLTKDTRFFKAACRASAFVAEHYIDCMRYNGGIHDSIYAKPQLVDGESIIFAMRALLELYKVTGDNAHLALARRAGQMMVTWICLWDVPLPPESTLARFGFRSTGWMACDAPGAGYVHPMGLLAIPDLVEIGRLTGDENFFRAAQLLQTGCNETVETPARSWGYARSGLQEEGLLISWWFADDPMFADTAFGHRGKGEGNKTCLPWISAVGAYSFYELVARYGSADIAIIETQARGSSMPS